MSRVGPDPEVVVNEGQLEQILAISEASQQDVMGEIISLLKETTPDKIDQLRQAALAKDPQLIRSTTHNLRSSFGPVGAGRLLHLCNQISQGAHQEDFAQVSSCIDRIDGELKALLLALGNYREQHPVKL